MPGPGETVKVANNLVTLSTILILNEAMALGAKFGIKRDILYEVLKDSSASCTVLTSAWGPKVLKGDFTPLFKLNLALKDVGLAVTCGKILKVPLFLGSLVREIYQMETYQGKGDLDPTSTITTLEKLAGFEIGREKWG
jgi:3-hydroxyisobutyrate dehydrogenase-like beta-hydroxyacid dehydrogenase